LKLGNKRLAALPPYPFAEVNKARDEAIRSGVDVIDMGVGNPDMRPDPIISTFLKEALDDQEIQNHRYPPFHGVREFREAIARWYMRRFNVSVDPETEILPLIGSKEGIAKFFLAHLDRDDIAIIASPCYPAYLGAIGISDGSLYEMPLLESNEFRPDLKAIPQDVLEKAKLILINYPNNPTGAVETRELYEDVLNLATMHDLIVISDIAYAELNLEPTYRSISFLEIPGAKERTIEFYSFSKTYSMPGWRLGFAAGDPTLIGNLLKIKTNMDFGVFMAMQRTGARILDAGDGLIEPTRRTYSRRRDVLLGELESTRLRPIKPLATIYVWAAIPPSFSSSMEFSKAVLTRSGVVLAPGSGFGTYGEGYVRISLIEEEARIREAVARMVKSGLI